MFASAHDLVRFGMFHIGDRQEDQKEILSEESRRKMQEPTQETGPQRGYGLGWFVEKNAAGDTSISHSGGMGGVSTLLMLVPAKRLVVVVLANSGTPLTGLITRRIMDKAYGSAAGAKNEEVPLEFKGMATDAATALAPLRGKWQGTVHTYEKDLPITLTVQEDGDVHVQFEGQMKTLLNGARFHDGWLRGPNAGRLEDRRYRAHSLRLALGSQTARRRFKRLAHGHLTPWAARRECADTLDRSTTAGRMNALRTVRQRHKINASAAHGLLVDPIFDRGAT